MKLQTLVLTAVFLAASARSAPLQTKAPDLLLEILGQIYPEDRLPASCPGILKGARCAEASFGTFHVQSKKDGELTFSTTTFSGPEGPQVIEKSWENSGRIRRAIIENRALRRLSELEVKDGKVHYKVTDLDTGQVKTSTDDAEDNLVVPSTVMSFLRPSFQGLKEGKEVRLKVAVLDRRESFSFVMRKVREETTSDGQEGMVLEMAPVSFIVKALVDPMYFFVKPVSGELYAFQGRSALRRRQGESWKEMNVQTAYEYKINRFSQVKVEPDCPNALSAGMGRNMKCEVKTQ
ncbi:hypothetical protein EB061_06360 [bacterium]|jgi:hypothetical protein|nr:hypothetical protein [bacterium]